MRRKWDRASLARLEAEYHAAGDARDVSREFAALEAITSAHPNVSWAWYDLGLRMKWLRQWERSRDANLRALELIDDTRESPEAWNLGIAATALGEWATARRAWIAFGIALPDGPEDEPILGDFGATPVRLNPAPRFAEPQLLIDGDEHSTEVVWARRLCPARAQIINVPLPDSGHRYGDVVLHDGDPVGTRRAGDSVRSVFNEIALMARGPFETLTTTINATPALDTDSLQELFIEHDFALEPWSGSVRVLCKACSEGSPSGPHDHPPGPATDTLRLGIAAPRVAAEALLDPWLAARGLERGPVAVAQ